VAEGGGGRIRGNHEVSRAIGGGKINMTSRKKKKKKVLKGKKAKVKNFNTRVQGEGLSAFGKGENRSGGVQRKTYDQSQ